MTLPEVFNPARCPLCGEVNHCLLTSSVAYKGQCWCTQVEVPHELLARVPENLRNRACICRPCVERFQREKFLSPGRSPHPTRRSPESP